MEELEVLVSENYIDIIGITETWCRYEIMNSETSLLGFKLYRIDRSQIIAKREAELCFMSAMM